MSPRYVIGIDPSGNFHEGKGTTGLCVFDTKSKKTVWVGYTQAKNYNTQTDYWDGVITDLSILCKRYKRCVISMEDYLLYHTTAKSQINSTFETPQLIGVIKMFCYDRGIALFMRPASRVKSRWKEDILVHKGYLYYTRKAGYYIYNEDGEAVQVIEHSRDAIKHAVHCAMFELEGETT